MKALKRRSQRLREEPPHSACGGFVSFGGRVRLGKRRLVSFPLAFGDGPLRYGYTA